MRTLALLALVTLPVMAGDASPVDDGFAAWFAQFQAVVARNDVKGIAALTHFPMEWELGSVRKIASPEDFVKSFPSYFPIHMRRAISHAKPVAVPEGYMTTWTTQGKEYSLYFRKIAGHFMLAALSEGPA